MKNATFAQVCTIALANCLTNLDCQLDLSVGDFLLSQINAQSDNKVIQC